VPTFHGLMPLPEADQLANRWGVGWQPDSAKPGRARQLIERLEVLLALRLGADGSRARHRIPDPSNENGPLAPFACALRHRHTLG